MKIAIIGSGSVGVALGKQWVKAGHQIVYGARDPESPKLLAALESTPGARSASVAAAAESCEAVVLATPWAATQAAVAACRNLAGKVVLDCTNPLVSLDGLSVGHTTSGGEEVARWVQGAHVVKIFNTVGANLMADPDFNGHAATMLYCGDNAEAKRTAHQLAADCGFDPVDAGPLRQARLLEPMAMLWISMAFAGKDREFCFKLLRRKA